MQDFSLENKITNGIVHYIKEVRLNFDLMGISIFFQTLDGKKKTVLIVEGLYNLSMKADSLEDFDDNGQLDYIQSLIGFSFEKTVIGYEYCLKTDAYEIIFESKNYPSIKKISE